MVPGVTAIALGMWACGVGGLGFRRVQISHDAAPLVTLSPMMNILLPGPQGLRARKEPGSITEV